VTSRSKRERKTGSVRHQEPGTTAKRKRERVLSLRKPPGTTPQQASADIVVEGLAANILTISDWSKWWHSDEQMPGITELYVSCAVAGQKVKAGDLSDLEAILTSQFLSMNAIFAKLTRHAFTTKLLEPFQVNMRLALKAQAQSRATAETIAVLKNPTVFARQANISSGPQQVNNVGQVQVAADARASFSDVAPIKLLEGSHVARLDGGAEGPAIGDDSAMEAVAVLNGTTDAGGESARLTERVPRRRAAEVPGDCAGAERVTPGTAPSPRTVRVRR
jgi:hypothetical protein